VTGRDQAETVMPYSVYILKSLKDGSYYIGSTGDLEERLLRHNQGRSKYTKSRTPWELIFHENHQDRSSAGKREQQIKKFKNKEAIERLVRTSRR